MRKLCITWVLVSNYSFTANVCMIFSKACKSYMFASLWKERFGKVFELFSWKRLFQCEILLWYSQVRSWLSLMSFFFILGGKKIYDCILKLHTVIKFVWEPVTMREYETKGDAWPGSSGGITWCVCSTPFLCGDHCVQRVTCGWTASACHLADCSQIRV